MTRVPVPRTQASWGEDDSATPILHVDMDAFFASVELMDRPELVGQPVIVGGDGRSVVLAATYEARAFGVHSAMPMAQAKRLCPQAVVLPPSKGKYSAISSQVMDVLSRITPEVEQISIDEAFLDVSGSIRRLGSPVEIATAIRAQVREDVGVVCSIGVASTMFVAKLASAAAKPDGLLLIPDDRSVDFLHSLPISALWGVGDITEKKLTAWGLSSVADLAQCDVRELERIIGPAHARKLHDLSWGRDDRQVSAQRAEEKSLGSEVTFDEDVTSAQELYKVILKLSDRCATRLRAEELLARTVVLKLRRSDFSTVTRSKTLPTPTDTTGPISDTVRALLDAEWVNSDPIRLIGVRVEGLLSVQDTPVQFALDEPDQGAREAEMAMDQVRKRFGGKSVMAGTLVDSHFTSNNRSGDISWGGR